MSNSEIYDYLLTMRQHCHESMHRNEEIGREDFYNLGQLAAIEQLCHFIRVREDLDV
jgi:hypothetical protein